MTRVSQRPPIGVVRLEFAVVKEHVWVGGVGPAPVAVVELGSDADSDGVGEQDAAGVDVQSAVGEVGQVHVAQFAGAQAVEGGQRGQGSTRRVGREQRFADRQEKHHPAAQEWASVALSAAEADVLACRRKPAGRRGSRRQACGQGPAAAGLTSA